MRSDCLRAKRGLDPTDNLLLRTIHEYQKGAAPQPVPAHHTSGDLPDGRRPPNSCPALPRKIFCFRFSELYVSLRASRPEQRGVTAKSSRTWGGVRWTRAARLTSAVCFVDGEAVWFWRPLAGVKFAKTPTRRADDGVNKAIGPRGERGISRKPLRGECRMFPVPPL